MALEAALAVVSKHWPFITFDDRYSVQRHGKCEKLMPQVTRVRKHGDVFYRNGTLKCGIEKERKENERISRLYCPAFEYNAVSRIFTDSGGATDQLKAIVSLTEDDIEKWNRDEDSIQLADVHNNMGMALMRGKPKDEEGIASWVRSYDAFRKIPDDPLDMINI
ncbi:hypothetical protein QBC44DRAFT_366473 [Cladorrhinum sp. PSN332]|nr:hypothetical protein QBC44DRAFT_366473 [Cladorrhinum sp. PSN332]